MGYRMGPYMARDNRKVRIVGLKKFTGIVWSGVKSGYWRCWWGKVMHR